MNRGDFMFRKVLVVPVLLATLVACGGKSKDATNAGTAASATSTACPSESTKMLAKTRFVGDAGLAFGAFHRWIWKPHQAGTFKAGAEGRTKALVKAAAAGAFAINRLNAARKLVGADPTQCKALKAPVEALWGGLSGLTGKLKSGDFTGTEIDSVQKSVEDLRSKAGQAGADITDKNVSIPGT
jgi:hypothetical protein